MPLHPIFRQHEVTLTISGRVLQVQGFPADAGKLDIDGNRLVPLVVVHNRSAGDAERLGCSAARKAGWLQLGAALGYGVARPACSVQAGRGYLRRYRSRPPATLSRVPIPPRLDCGSSE